MPGTAPAALLWLADQWTGAIGSAKFSGIVSGTAPYYGYHHAPPFLPASDYSLQLPEDRAGSREYASAIDISMSPSDMRLVTGRLIASADDPDDPRLNYCREFYGTTDSRNVVGRDTYHGRFASSDDSHLWHVHISFLRQYANSMDAAKAVLSIVTDAGTGKDDMTPEQDFMLREIVGHLRRQRWMWKPTKTQWVSSGGNAAVFDQLGDDVMINALVDAAGVEPDELAAVHAAAKAGSAEATSAIVAGVLAGLPKSWGDQQRADVEAAVRRVFADAGDGSSVSPA